MDKCNVKCNFRRNAPFLNAELKKTSSPAVISVTLTGSGGSITASLCLAAVRKPTLFKGMVFLLYELSRSCFVHLDSPKLTEPVSQRPPLKETHGHNVQESTSSPQHAILFFGQRCSISHASEWKVTSTKGRRAISIMPSCHRVTHR